MPREKRMDILQAIDSRTKVMALIALIAEALFLGSLAAIPSHETLYALIACVVILVVTLAGIILIEVTELRTKRAGSGSDGKDPHSDDGTNIPENIRQELSLPFVVRRDKQSEGQREILDFIERHTAVAESVSQTKLEEQFARHAGRHVYWRLEVLRYLGFLEKVDTGERHGNKPRFSYRLSTEYRNERSGTFG